MRVYEGTSARHVYRRQLADLVDHGDRVQIKGYPTREFLNVATVLHNPDRRPLMIPGRFDNPFLALSECLWVVAGRNDVAALKPYNARIVDFSDDGETLYGAYGFRVKGQIQGVIDRLRTDPTDRRAFLLIWQEADLFKQTKDPPCNGSVMFKWRNDKLHMTVTNRSNDLHWGLHAVNLPEFSFLQEYIATRLGIEIGTQTHISNSLHIYEDPHPGARVTQGMLKVMNSNLPIIPEAKPLFGIGLPSHSDFVRSCNDVLDQMGLDCGEDVPFLEFADDFLRAYRERKEILGMPPLKLFCRHGEDYADWAAAGDRFLQYVKGT